MSHGWQRGQSGGGKKVVHHRGDQACQTVRHTPPRSLYQGGEGRGREKSGRGDKYTTKGLGTFTSLLKQCMRRYINGVYFVVLIS